MFPERDEWSLSNRSKALKTTAAKHTHTGALQNHAGCGTVIGRDADATATREHLAELGAEAVVQPGVEERVTAGRAHGAQVAEQLDEQEVPLIDQVDVNVAQNVEDADGQPADAERRHHQAHQAEGLAFAHALGLRLALGVVAGHHTVPQLDRDAQVRDAERGEGQDVGDEEGAVRVGQPLALLAHPELLADGEALVLKLHVVGVSHGWSHQAAGQQPDPGQEVGARQHRDALFQRVHRGVVSVKTEEEESGFRWGACQVTQFQRRSFCSTTDNNSLV